MIGIAALAALVGMSLLVQDISREKDELEVLYLPSGQFMEQLALGYRNLSADVLWFKTVQYYGGYRLGQNNLNLFRHLVDVITDLDPQFIFAYLFGGMIIVEDLGCFEEGIKFLEKGVENNPTNWWLVFEMGFLHYVKARDYDSATRYFQLASKLPGADSITKRFAAFVAMKAGHRETSLLMWKELERTADNQAMKDLARYNIEKLENGNGDGNIDDGKDIGEMENRSGDR